MDKEIRYFVNGYEMLLYLSGDREERKSVDCFELQDFESEEKAVAAARCHSRIYQHLGRERYSDFSQTVTVANMGRSRRSRGTGSCRNAISFPA